jgi:transcriptional regulator with XRE-family HTH domain
VKSRDLIRIARDRAGLSQEQLAVRSRRPRSTIARWESGARSPSLESLEEVIRAAGLDLVISLAEHDRSLEELVRDQLELSPAQRLRRLLPEGEADQVIAGLDTVAELATPAIVVGSVAAALRGAPQRPRENVVEVLAGDRDGLLQELRDRGAEPTDDEERFSDVNRRWRWRLLPVGTLAVTDLLAGAGGYSDLRRDATAITVDGHEVTVAGTRDLLRLADASPDEKDRAYAPGLRTLLAQDARDGTPG